MEPEYPNIRIGLCCININLKYAQDIFSSRRRILNTLLTKGLKEGLEAAKDNLVDLLKMIVWNKKHGIQVMRISSELVPHGSNVEIVKRFGEAGKKYLELEYIKKYLRIVGKIARYEGMRLTFHPGQFVQVASPSEKVFENSVRELEMHCRFLDLMKMPSDSVVVIHIGGTYCDKSQTIERFIKRFKTIPEFVKRRIVLENDEKCYDADDVLNICKKLNVPMVFDIFHYYCYALYHPNKKQKLINEMMPDILKTWTDRNIRPKFHLSEQMKGKPVGSHSLFVNSIPKEFLQIPKKYNIPIDIMIEAKGKEVAISKLYEKYPKLKPPNTKPLPKRIPKNALDDLKLTPEVRELASCECY